jgi:hypothetical protein
METAPRRRRLPSLHVRAHCHDGAGAPLAVRLVHGLRHRLGRGGPDGREDTHRRPALAPALDQKEPDSAVCCLSCLSCHRRLECNHILRAPRSEPLGCAIGWARLARSDVDQLSCMGLCLLSRRRLCAVCACCRSSALALSDGSAEWVICRSSRCFQRARNVSSWVPPVGRGSWGLMPLAARHTAISPMRAVFGWLPAGPPDRMATERFWNAREPGQRTWVGRRERWEAPVEDSRHVVCGSKVMSGGGCQQVAERPLSRLGHEGEQVRSQGWPGRLVGESGG